MLQTWDLLNVVSELLFIADNVHKIIQIVELESLGQVCLDFVINLELVAQLSKYLAWRASCVERGLVCVSMRMGVEVEVWKLGFCYIPLYLDKNLAYAFRL